MPPRPGQPAGLCPRCKNDKCTCRRSWAGPLTRFQARGLIRYFRKGAVNWEETRYPGFPLAHDHYHLVADLSDRLAT